MMWEFITSIDGKDVAFYTMFVILYFFVPYKVVTQSYSNKTKFDVRSLWERKDGTLEGLFIIALGTWWVHTSSMILWTILQKVATADYVTYMGWGALVIGKIAVEKFRNGKGGEHGNGTEGAGQVPKG